VPRGTRQLFRENGFCDGRTIVREPERRKSVVWNTFSNGDVLRLCTFYLLSTGALFAYLPHCAAGILILLVWQFNSFRRPAIMVLTIPLIVIGVTAGLWCARVQL